MLAKADPAIRRLFAKLPLVIIAIALSMMAMSMAAGRTHPDTAATFYSQTGSWAQYLKMRQEWKPRMLSNTLAGVVARTVGVVATSREGQVAATVGVWTFAWFLTTCGLFIVFRPDSALYYMFGCFARPRLRVLASRRHAGLSLDLPGLFVFAVFVLLLDRSKWSTLLYFLPLAALFKETSLVLCLALLFSPQTLSRRLRMFGLAVLCSVLVKGSMDVLVQNPIPLLSMTAQTSRNADTFVRLLGNADALRAVSRYSHQTQAVTFQHPYL